MQSLVCRDRDTWPLPVPTGPVWYSPIHQVISPRQCQHHARVCVCSYHRKRSGQSMHHPSLPTGSALSIGHQSWQALPHTCAVSASQSLASRTKEPCTRRSQQTVLRAASAKPWSRGHRLHRQTRFLVPTRSPLPPSIPQTERLRLPHRPLCASIIITPLAVTQSHREPDAHKQLHHGLFSQLSKCPAPPNLGPHYRVLI